MSAALYAEKLARAKGKRDALRERAAAALSDLEKARENYEAVTHAQIFLQTVAQETQNSLRIHLQDIVQLALDSCFPGEYVFQIRFEIKRGQTEAELLLEKEGQPIDPMSSTGGGVVDVLAFGLRIAAYTLSKSDNVIVLDEPFRFLSQNLQPRAGEIIRELSHRLGLQFIMVTHSPAIVDSADRVFTVKQSGGKSRVLSEQREPA